MDIGGADEVTILLVDTRGALLERLSVCRRPPVPEIAFSVKLSPLIIEAMRDLMPDHSTNTAVIYSIVELRIEECRLQNTRREVNAVFGRHVISINGWRCHPPFL